jgi:NAD(P)-dependent dehydrogenase (short-subunit alcohol dehydrogenase family)
MQSWVKEWDSRTPIGRFARAEEIGKFVAVVLSNHAAGAGFMTGSDLVIDGGECPVFLCLQIRLEWIEIDMGFELG